MEEQVSSALSRCWVWAVSVLLALNSQDPSQKRYSVYTHCVKEETVPRMTGINDTGNAHSANIYQGCFCIDKKVENHNSWIGWSFYEMVPHFINQVLLEHSHAYLATHSCYNSRGQ